LEPIIFHASARFRKWQPGGPDSGLADRG